MPMTPSVRPASSIPSGTPTWRAAKACRAAGARRASDSNRNSVASATATWFVPGALHTGMPRAAAAATSISSVPAAGCWISRNCFAAATTSAVITAFDGSSTSTSPTTSASGARRSHAPIVALDGNRARTQSIIGSQPEPQNRMCIG